MKEGFKIVGELELILRDKDGNIKDYRKLKNLIVTAGLNAVRQQVLKSAAQPAAFDYCAIGEDDTAAAAGNTALGSEADREQGTYSEPGSAQGKIATTFDAGEGTGTITEAGLLNAASDGTLLNRQTFTAIDKGADDSLTVNWTFTFASG